MTKFTQISAPKLLLIIIIMAWAQILPQPAAAAELLAVMRADCPYCRAWEIEVGRIYERTDEGRIAPLRRIDVRDTPYELREPVLYTPTFILVERDAEVGRIVGFSDDATFWGMLANLLSKIRPGCRNNGCSHDAGH